MITGSYTTRSQETYANAVAVVCRYDCDVMNSGFFFVVCVWKTEASYNNGDAPVDERIPTFIVDNTEGGTDYTDYFSSGVLDDTGKHPVERAEAYLVAKASQFKTWTTV